MKRISILIAFVFVFLAVGQEVQRAAYGLTVPG